MWSAVKLNREAKTFKTKLVQHISPLDHIYPPTFDVRVTEEQSGTGVYFWPLTSAGLKAGEWTAVN